MENYIDGFVFPIPKNQLDTYRAVAEKVAEIWKEHGALAYNEYVGDDLKLEGTRAFPEFLASTEDEAVVFGWVVFDSKETRDLANQRVATDPRMSDIIAPLTAATNPIFDASRMVYGGFQSLVQSKSKAS